MDEIVKKLMASGVSSDMIDKLKSGLGDKFESEMMSGGLKAAAAKLGLDASALPEIDWKNSLEAVEELTGKDLNRDGKVGDGDGKTGVMEAVENAKEAMANSDMSGLKKMATTQGGGLLAKIKGFLGV